MTSDREPTVVTRRVLIIVLMAASVLAGTAVVLLAMSLLGSPRPLAGADATATPTGSPTAAQPTASATAEPTAEPTAQQLDPDTIAVVTVNELNLRAEPSSRATSFGHLSAGDRVFVVEGPEQSDGYGWYRVATVDETVTPQTCQENCPSAQMGWVVGISDAQDAWLAPTELTCSSDPKLDVFERLAPFERLACYGDQTLTLKGVVWQPCCGYVGAFNPEPGWLSWPTSAAYLTSGELHRGGLMLRFDPAAGLAIPKYADIVRVAGHMDDAAAHTCTVKIDESALLTDPTLAVDSEELAYAPVGCRTEFVVESIEILGNTGEKCEC